MQAKSAGKWAILEAAQFIIVIDTTIMKVSVSNILADIKSTGHRL